MKYRKITAIAAILGAVAVVLGAFAAHSLKSQLEPPSLAAFETGVRYHFIHVLVLMFTGTIIQENKMLILAEKFILAGIVLFSGSLYLLSTSTLWAESSLSWLGPVTPIGGICFIIGWIFLARFFLKASTQS